ncbi:MAG: response regulator transcription factor [Solirubrobacteraceae bacterium]
MRERRPHRPALDAAGAEAELLRDAREGRLCPEAVDAVLAAAGHRVAKRPRELPAGLTDRELEVLLALAAGKTNKEIAETLGISAKTAGHHVQHIFDKTGARTRTAATVWAFRACSADHETYVGSRFRGCARGLCRARSGRERGGDDLDETFGIRRGGPQPGRPAGLAFADDGHAGSCVCGHR